MSLSAAIHAQTSDTLRNGPAPVQRCASRHPTIPNWPCCYRGQRRSLVLQSLAFGIIVIDGKLDFLEILTFQGIC